MNTLTNAINIVRFSRGDEFVRFEIAEGCPVATRHSSSSAPRTMFLDEVRQETAALAADKTWTISTV